MRYALSLIWGEGRDGLVQRVACVRTPRAHTHTGEGEQIPGSRCTTGPHCACQQLSGGCPHADGSSSAGEVPWFPSTLTTSQVCRTTPCVLGG